MPPIVTSPAAAAMSAATTASRSPVRDVSSNSAASGRKQRTPRRTTTSRSFTCARETVTPCAGCQPVGTSGQLDRKRRTPVAVEAVK